MEGGGEIDPSGLCTHGLLYHVSAWFPGFRFQFFKSTYLFNVIMNGCLLAIDDLRILQLLDRNLQLNVWLPITIVLFRRVEEFFKLLFCNDFFTPATIIGDENSA